MKYTKVVHITRYEDRREREKGREGGRGYKVVCLGEPSGSCFMVADD